MTFSAILLKSVKFSFFMKHKGWLAEIYGNGLDSQPSQWLEMVINKDLQALQLSLKTRG